MRLVEVVGEGTRVVVDDAILELSELSDQTFESNSCAFPLRPFACRDDLILWPESDAFSSSEGTGLGLAAWPSSRIPL